ncbi:MAG: hypothetical protein LBQ12_14485 [Deltaproteobacteria bacterium]|jgi:hypothetical protein|nr:hypothetical protein [Deltaproteobacteria bacterium]
MSIPTRYKWPELARDYVFQGLPAPVDLGGLEKMLKHYEITPEQFQEILDTSEFQCLLSSEKIRAERLGDIAPQVYRVEAMLGPLTEKLFKRLMSDDCKVEDMVKGFSAILRSAGMDQPSIVTTQSGPAVAVQINVPGLENAKLRHIEGTVVVNPAEALEQ